jgi:hypothetical protein
MPNNKTLKPETIRRRIQKLYKQAICNNDTHFKIAKDIDNKIEALRQRCNHSLDTSALSVGAVFTVCTIYGHRQLNYSD